MERPGAALIFRICGFFISTAGIVSHLLTDRMVRTGFMVNHKLAYFTIQTNVMVAALFLVLTVQALAAWHREGRLKVARVSLGLHLGLTLYITLTMLGFWLILAPATGLPLNPYLFWSSFILHTATPLLAIVDYGLFGTHGQLQYRTALRWLGYPAGYLVFVMLYSRTLETPYYSFQMGERTVDLMVPYPFLDAEIMGPWGVAGAIVGLAAVFWLLGLFYIKMDRLLARKKD